MSDIPRASSAGTFSQTKPILQTCKETLLKETEDEEALRRAKRDQIVGTLLEYIDNAENALSMLVLEMDDDQCKSGHEISTACGTVKYTVAKLAEKGYLSEEKKQTLWREADGVNNYILCAKICGLGHHGRNNCFP